MQTRLDKLQQRAIDATILAVAGLERLNLADKATSILSATDMLPAVAQGAIGIEIRVYDDIARAILAPLNDWKTSICIRAERACLLELDGSCRTPIAALAHYHESSKKLSLRAMLASPDGQKIVFVDQQGLSQQPETLGHQAGTAVRQKFMRIGE